MLEFYKTKSVAIGIADNLSKIDFANGISTINGRGMIIDKHVLSDSKSLVQTVVHEYVHLMGGNEIEAYGVGLVTGTMSNKGLLDRIKQANRDSNIGDLLLGASEELKFEIMSYPATDYSNEIINQFKQTGEAWLEKQK